MGQAPVENMEVNKSNEISGLSSKLKPNSSLYANLSKLIHNVNFKKINDKEGELKDANGLTQDIIKFVTKVQIKEFSQFSGYASLISKEGIKIFEGEFYKGQRQGFGIQYQLNGNLLYGGYFLKNLYHGWGKTEDYEGEFINGKKNGWGIYEPKQGIDKVPLRYEGYWRQDKFHGIGALNVPKKQIDDFLKDSYKKVNFEQNEVKYVGQWKYGVIEGVGKLMKKTQTYMGQFVRGQYEGEGILKQINKEPVRGRFLKGKLI